MQSSADPKPSFKPTRSSRGLEADGPTRERLLLTAERLFANEGFGNVSLRRINTEAGQRNAAAVHYHFGSLEAIVSAIFEYRMPATDGRRGGLLDELVASGRSSDLYAVVQAAIQPMSEQILESADGSSFVRFAAAVARDPSLDHWTYIRHRYRRSLVRTYVLIRRILHTLPPQIVHVRLAVTLRQIQYSLADVDQVITERHADVRDEMVRFHTSDLISRVVQELSAPVTPATLAALRTLAAHPGSQRHGLLGVDSIRAFPRKRGTL